MLDLKDANGTFFKPATIMVSTVEMPKGLYPKIINYRYETAVRSRADIDVVERYEFLSEATAGHIRHCKANLSTYNRCN